MAELADPYPVTATDIVLEDELGHLAGFAFPFGELAAVHVWVAYVGEEDPLFLGAGVVGLGGGLG